MVKKNTDSKYRHFSSASSHSLLFQLGGLGLEGRLRPSLPCFGNLALWNIKFYHTAKAPKHGRWVPFSHSGHGELLISVCLVWHRTLMLAFSQHWLRYRGALRVFQPQVLRTRLLEKCTSESHSVPEPVKLRMFCWVYTDIWWISNHLIFNWTQTKCKSIRK